MSAWRRDGTTRSRNLAEAALSLLAMVGSCWRLLAALRSYALVSAIALAACAPHPAEEVVVEQDPPVPAGVLGPRREVAHAPIALTASDGTQLQLVALRASAVVEQPLAFTELRLVFENAEDRTIEGRFRIDMPTGAAISRFAMKIGDVWQDAEVVERRRARAIYEDHLHRRQDPALLEHEGGNTFGARVFPIGPYERKEIIVSYSQELPHVDAPYRLALRGLPRLEALDVELVEREGNAVARRTERHEFRYLPSADLELPLSRMHGDAALRSGDLAVARVTPVFATDIRGFSNLTVLFDTSASRAVGFDTHIHRLGDAVRALRDRTGRDFALRVLAFDQSTAPIFSGQASAFGHDELESIASGRALGASDLVAALREVAAGPQAADRVLVFTDGIATAGPTDLAALEAAARALAQSGVQRIDVVLDQGSHDDASMRALTAVATETGVVIDAGSSAEEIASRLGYDTAPAMRVSVPGAQWVWPEVVEGIQPGDGVLVYAQLPAKRDMIVEVEGLQAVRMLERRAERPLLERAWARARVEHLQMQRSRQTDASARMRLETEIVELSTRFRVLSELTALLVLEHEADYRRYDLHRRGLADILAVGSDGVEVLHRSGIPAIPFVGQHSGSPIVRNDAVIPQMARNFDPELTQRNAGILGMVQPDSGYGAAYSVGSDDEDVWGGLTGTEIGAAAGLVGTGRGGGGTDAGFRDTPRRSPARVRQARAEVRGAIDRDIVRRIVRAHLSEIRHCYLLALERDPSRRGRVTIQFTISPTGHVPVAIVSTTSTGDRALDTCIARAVKRWRFPKPEDGGRVVVDLPFVLESDGHPVHEPVVAEPWPIADAPTQPAAPNGSGTAYDVVVARLAEHDTSGALTHVLDWRDRDPHDVLALVALGEIAERVGDRRLAARAYGSIIDLHSGRAELRRYAGARLERLGAVGLRLALDSYEKALASRPDHPSAHRLFAYAAVKAGRHADAFATLHRALTASPTGDDRIHWERFPGAPRILREDLAIIASAWIAAEPAAGPKIEAELGKLALVPARAASVRFVMTWETDANDIDFHIHDAAGNHAYYGARRLASGGELYADITTGFGPECFAVEGPALAGPYELTAKYFSRGAMGFGMGKLQIVAHDGRGHLTFDERPFVITSDGQVADLGTYPAG